MALLPVLKSTRGDIAGLHRQMDEMLSSFFGDWPGLDFERNLWPPIDIAESEDQITVKAEVPGCKAEDIVNTVAMTAIQATSMKGRG